MPVASDPLGVIISLLRPQSVASKIVSGAGKWSVRYEKYDDPGFCVLLAGTCFLDADGIGLVELREGDFVLLPQTPAFTMASDPKLKPRAVAPTSNNVRHGSGRTTMRMLGGYFHFDKANAHLLLSLLPPMIHIRREEEGAEPLRRIVELIAREAAADRTARDLVLDRLVEVLLIEALRCESSLTDHQKGLLAGLADPALAKPLRGIHTHAARPWTVAELARTAGMSRSVFAERFVSKLGISPMQYLFEWRMALAKDLLRGDRPPLEEIAEKIGYESASAFSTAFSRLNGIPPSKFAQV